MRIVAGQFRGRRLVAPSDPRVRPTADRVREAWMSILGDAITGARVLDLFAGSGTTGIAALAEGFEFVGIEFNPDYATIASARLRRALGAGEPRAENAPI